MIQTTLIHSLSRNHFNVTKIPVINPEMPHWVRLKNNYFEIVAVKKLPKKMCLDPDGLDLSGYKKVSFSKEELYARKLRRKVDYYINNENYIVNCTLVYPETPDKKSDWTFKGITKKYISVYNWLPSGTVLELVKESKNKRVYKIAEGPSIPVQKLHKSADNILGCSLTRFITSLKNSRTFNERHMIGWTLDGTLTVRGQTWEGFFDSPTLPDFLNFFRYIHVKNAQPKILLPGGARKSISLPVMYSILSESKFDFFVEDTDLLLTNLYNTLLFWLPKCKGYYFDEFDDVSPSNVTTKKRIRKKTRKNYEKKRDKDLPNLYQYIHSDCLMKKFKGLEKPQFFEGGLWFPQHKIRISTNKTELLNTDLWGFQYVGNRLECITREIGAKRFKKGLYFPVKVPKVDRFTHVMEFVV